MQSHWDKLPTLRVIDAGYLLAGMEPGGRWQSAPPLIKNFFNLIHDRTGAVTTQTTPDGRSTITQAEYQALKAEFGVTPAKQPEAASVVRAAETKEQRQDRRLNACISAGLPMNARAALLRLPDGVGKVADREGVSRQTFSSDVKAALKRRESGIKEGRIVLLA